MPASESKQVAEPAEDEVEQADVSRLQVALSQAAIEQDYKKRAKDKYAFWETQPVVQFSESLQSGQDGPIDKPKTVAEVRQEPYNLPESFEWCTCNLKDDDTVVEVFELLSNNYVEDDDNMFRFRYSPAFLRWALQPPGHVDDWLLGVRVRTGARKLIGFISAVPGNIRVDDKEVDMVEINFLCVHKKLRAKRLAPVLIKEITRRVNLKGIWQAAYTAGTIIPKPYATCRYWHRSLNPKKLIDVKFSRLAPRMTMARTIKLYKLPDAPATPGLRPMQLKDVPQVHKLLNEYLGKFRVAQVYTEEEVQHWFMPQDMVINAYVVADESGKITDLVSFYTLPSTVLGHPEHNEIRAAYLYYTVPGAAPLKQLVNDAMILAKASGYDVFNALDLLQNSEVLRDLKFGIGDGQLHYYLYNWRVSVPLAPHEVGLILM